MESLIGLLVAAPLLGAAVLLLGGRRLDRAGHWLGTALAAVSFVLGAVLFFDMLGRPGEDRTLHQFLFSWIPVEGFQADAAFRLDQLSMTFVLLITGVGTLIHLYSVGYMEHDARRRRFFGYLNLFLAAMLLLVLADNYLLLYVGWEGVGLASYLLIGFWQHKPSAATAAKKAFLVNRVGDAGLAIAIFLMFTTFGTFAFSEVLPAADGASEGVLTGIGLMLLLAACGKSAQVPLQSWLGDAMEGPTPVSALIHAATMVTAGVYLITRSGALFDAAPAAQTAVVAVGAVTLLFGAIVGCAKDDIKKALAASTMSQIGYMVLAAGLGPIGYAFAIMHLVTHGFFKAGLFLGAGSVMHGMNDEVNMRKYGGLRRYMPVTFVTFGLGYLAIIGFPGLSGFFSKDLIIEAAFSAGGVRGWVLGGATLLGAALTAYYMTRVMLLTFFGEERWRVRPAPAPTPAPAESGAAPAAVAGGAGVGAAGGTGAPGGAAGTAGSGAGAGSAGSGAGGSPAASGQAAGLAGEPHPHESPKVMTVPMIVLAFGSVFAGGLFNWGEAFVHWLEPVTAFEHPHPPIPIPVITGATVAVMLLGVGLAWLQYGRKPVPLTAPRGSLLTRAARRDLLQDDFNHAAFVSGGQHLTRSLVYLDHTVVDGGVNGTAAAFGGLSARLRKVQNGFARSYAVSMFGGAAVLVAATLLMRAV
ncbi:NADH-quinone oxidoreductase subunit L [Streptomyces sp. JJ66]|uniref:NADH-quinone oxidoreductase subunit L n=1 Tax=Streptomyces sp. JJ66 TaxID=2803843 RepID=UPI001C591133|nr:NADH-quinone oxidoreductase subunit L [Streptomyces sp. JJ66]MBW1602578.1 NADH-quinone oxidoreductase subunit L [Streptomyces sp. JJ66]